MIRAILTSGSMRSLRQTPGQIVCYETRTYLVSPTAAALGLAQRPECGEHHATGVDLLAIGLDPAKKGRVVHRDAPVLQHQLEIVVADREHQIPVHGPQDHLGRELPALELFALPHDTRTVIRLSRRHVYPIRTRLTNLQQSPICWRTPLRGEE